MSTIQKLREALQAVITAHEAGLREIGERMVAANQTSVQIEGQALLDTFAAIELARQALALPTAAPAVPFGTVVDDEMIGKSIEYTKSTLQALPVGTKLYAHAEPAVPSEIDVRTILLDIVPGDGNGHEVYAKNVEDVVNKLTVMCERLEAAERERDYYKSRAQTMYEHQKGEVWYWQGDGEDHPESWVNSLPVVIRADQLRELMAKPAVPQGEPVAWVSSANTAFVTTDKRTAKQWARNGYEPRPTAYCDQPQASAPAVTAEKLDALVEAYTDWQGWLEHGSSEYFDKVAVEKQSNYEQLKAELLAATPAPAPAQESNKSDWRKQPWGFGEKRLGVFKEPEQEVGLTDADAIEIGNAAGLPMAAKSGDYPWAYIDRVVAAIKNAHARGFRAKGAA